ncbi:hypothetical protein WJX73_007183 [Symbiochloris irregularis]|uniref:Uncharacterized protein n=1 Tax=Symbiochloris irregularis TaxID=706552 RepID=A0AAW1NV49_9CHLO
MPAAKKAAGGKKSKAPAYETSPEALEPFGVQRREMSRGQCLLQVAEPLQTPLCLKASVLGVKAADGRLWVTYSTGIDAPLQPKASDGPLEELGYIKANGMEQVLNQLKALEDDLTSWHLKQAAAKLKEQGKGKDGKAAPAKKKGK